jgi:hypothetical protein
MKNYIEVDGLKVVPSYSAEDDVFFVELKFIGGGVAYCCGETAAELRKQISEALELRRDAGFSTQLSFATKTRNALQALTAPSQ